MKDKRVIFMGTPSFAVPILEGLIKEYNVVLVVSQPDRKKNRHGDVIIPDIKRVALENNIPVLQPNSIKEEYEEILSYHPDIIITCAYGQIIPKVVLDAPEYGVINVHGSLLPKLRGGAPIHWSIINGMQETGVTIMKSDVKMDSGDIISKRSIKIKEDDILDTLYGKLSVLGRDLLLETLPTILNKTCSYIKQDENEATFGFNITKEDAHLNFNENAYKIKNKIRGLNSIPAAYCYLNEKRIKIYDIEILEKKSNKEPGYILDINKDGILVSTKDNLINIKELAIEGKKRMLINECINGMKKEEYIGKVLN